MSSGAAAWPQPSRRPRSLLHPTCTTTATTGADSLCRTHASASALPLLMSDSSLLSGASWVVHKFGGTSLATAECYANSAEIIRALPLYAEPDESTAAAAAAASSSSAPSAAAAAPIPLRKCIVVSAMGEVKTGPGSLVAALIRQRSPGTEPVAADKITNLLIKATEGAAKRDASYLDIVAQLRARHIRVVEQLLGGGSADASDPTAKQLRQSVLAALDSDFNDLSYILRAVWLSRAFDPMHNWWYGFGEIWSARLMQAYLNLLDARACSSSSTVAAGSALSSRRPAAEESQQALLIDARDIVYLTKQHKDPTPDYALSEAKLNEWLNSSPEARSARIVVVTGYIASTAESTPTTLGRDGSDYSASIFASLLRARSVSIWTDVDGVYSANPAAVRSAVILPRLSYDEASELAYFGAKVLHPKTMTPVVRQAIPVWIRNTFRPEHPGTCIVSAAQIAREEKQREQAIAAAALASTPKPGGVAPSLLPLSAWPPLQQVEFGVRGFSEISNLSLLIVEGTGMIGVPGVCARLFGALREAGVSVVLVTQAGSEHSICLCVPRSQGKHGCDVIRREFRDELSGGEITTVDHREDVACLAIVGDGMRSRRGAAARMFAALADAGINIMAIAQGSSERNISVIVAQKQVQVGLQAVHAAFLFSSPPPSPRLSASPEVSASPEGSDDLTLLSDSASPPPMLAAPPSSFSSSTLQCRSTASTFDLALLGRLFPLPLAATLQGLFQRNCRVGRIVALLPTPLVKLLSAGSSALPAQPDWARMQRSFSTMAAVLVALARVCHCAPTRADLVAIPADLLTATPKEVSAFTFKALTHRTHRLLCVLDVDADTHAAHMAIVHVDQFASINAAAHAVAAASSPSSRIGSASVPTLPAALFTTQGDQAVIAIYTRGGAQDATPILLQGPVAEEDLQPSQQ